MHSVPAVIGSAVRRLGMPVLRLAVGVTLLWLIVRHLGAAPFRAGLDAVTWQAVAAAVTLTALTTVCSAWRWRVVARALGVGIGMPAAISAYYRSLFLNSVLIGGVLGDVHRAVTHGRRAGDVARGVRSVGWERLCGQIVQAVVTVVVLLPLLGRREDAEHISAKISAALEQPVLFNQQTLSIGASLGIGIWPLDGERPDLLLKSAAAHMYREKNIKRRRWYEADEHPPDQPVIAAATRHTQKL